MFFFLGEWLTAIRPARTRLKKSARFVWGATVPRAFFLWVSLKMEFKVMGHTFRVPSHYRFVKALGHGSYGTVVLARDTRRHKDRAIKRIHKAFHEDECRYTLREVWISRRMNHPNIVRTIETFADTRNVYVVQQHMQTDLSRIVSSKQTLTDDHIKYFMYQILCAVNYIEGCGLVHRDIKPANILVNEDCHVRLCDFGLSRSLSTEMSEYVVTRWYRPPEILLGAEYTCKADTWSIGCIFAELLLRVPYFPGQSDIDQLSRIFTALGTPTETTWPGVSS